MPARMSTDVQEVKNPVVPCVVRHFETQPKSIARTYHSIYVDVRARSLLSKIS